MMRVFPTQLKVVSHPRELKAEDENAKGYYDGKAKGCLQVGVSRNKIYLNSPHNWYRSYTFVVNPTTLPTPAAVSLFNEAVTKKEESDDDEESEIVLQKDMGNGSLWRIVASVIKTHCGRRVVYVPGDRFVTVPFVDKSQAKRIYYQFQHVLASLSVEYTVSHSWFSPTFASATAPDVRTKPRRRRKKHNIEALEAMHRNKWVNV